MAEIVLAVVGPAIELGKCIAEPMKRQINYLRCFNNNVQNLREEVKKLEEKREELQGRVRRDRDNNQVILPIATNWLADEELLQVNRSEIDSEIDSIKSGCLAVKSRYSLSKKVEKTTEALKKHRDACPRSDEPISRPPSPLASVSNIPLGPTPYEFESRKKNEEDILMALENSSVHIVGIWGMGGVGKTTMAKSVIRKVLEEREAQEEKLFDEIVDLTVSQHVDKLKIQGVMAGRLGLKLVGENSDLSYRAKQLQDRLKGRKILLFLDDVWECLDLEELIGLSRQGGLEGCKVLLTSRHNDVLSKMEAERVFEIRTLSKSEAWSLFEDKTGGVDPNLLSLAQGIVSECKGLPIALVNVAAALKVRKHERIWKDALVQLKGANPRDLPDILRTVYIPLRLSYDFLKSERAKIVFLLCCLFPEDSNIPLEYLALYALGLSTFEDIKNLDQVRNRTLSLIEMLKSRSLLLEGKDKDHVIMHDVVRDVAIFIATKEERIKCGDCTWASPYVGGRIEFPVGSNLNLLMFDEIADKERQIDDSFFRGKIDLKVLSIHENWELRSLPHTIEFGMNIRTLILQSCWFLETICVVGEFVNLEVLICRDCPRLKELPTERTRLKCLRLLEISDCRALQQIAAGVISSLDKLEELKIVRSFKKWEGDKKEGGGGGNARLSELGSLLNLTCLEIEIEDYNLAAQHISLSPKIVKYDIKIGEVTSHEKISAEKKLGVHLPQEITLGNWIHECAKSAEWISSEGDGSKSLDLGLAHQNLRSLYIESCRSTLSSVLWGSRGVTTNVFPLLEYLQLRGLANLEEIGHIDGPLLNASSSSSSDNISFRNLQNLYLIYLPALKCLWKRGPYQDKVVPLIFSNLSFILVSGCHSLPNLLSLSTTTDVCFSQLEGLCIKGCDMMEQVFLWSEEEKEKNIGQGNRRTIRFPKLQSLSLEDLRRLKTLCQGIETIEFPLLTRVEIRWCPNLKGLVSASDGGIENDKVVFGQLLDLTIHDSMPIWCDSTPIDFFTTLAVLRIDLCDGIKSLFSFPIACNLTHLKALTIERCGEMVKVIGGEEDYSSNESTTDHFSELNSRVESVRFPKLETLKLMNLPRLTSFCNGSGNIEFPLLTCLEIKECPNLKGLVSASDEGIENRKVVFGKLKDLTICFLPIWWDQTPVNFFAALVALNIENCVEIRSLFSFPTACNLNNLEKLTIGSCKEMVKVIEGDLEYSSNESTTDLFPNLKSLSLLELPELKIFSQLGHALHLPSLSRVKIKGCPKLERFSLGSLTTPQLKTVSTGYAYITFDKEQDLNGVLQQKVVFRKFEQLTIDTLMPVWLDPTPVDFFTAIVELTLKGFILNNLDHRRLTIRSLFSFPVACNLNNLKELSIGDCPEMVKVIEGEEEYSSNEPTTGLFPCLRELTLSWLPKLKIFSQLGRALNLPSLSHVEIRRCPKLESFSLGSLTTPQLKTIRVNWKEIASDKEQGLNGVLRRHYLLRQEEEESTSNLNVDLDMDKQNNGAVESKRNVIDQEEKEECETEQEECEAGQERE